MIKPLRDYIVAIPIEETGKVGALYMPDNTLQALRTHRKMLVLYAGPKAKELGCSCGVVVHASDIWGDVIVHRERKMWIGRLRDVNGICEDVAIQDVNRYSD